MDSRSLKHGLALGLDSQHDLITAYLLRKNFFRLTHSTSIYCRGKMHFKNQATNISGEVSEGLGKR